MKSLRQTLRKLPLAGRWLRYRETRELLQNDGIALQHLARIPLGWQPWTSSAIQPSSLRVILNEMIIHQRQNLLEIGAGLSTFFLAQIAREEGRRVVSIDQSADWLEIVQRGLKKEGLEDAVQLMHIPLESTPDQTWFSETALREALGDQQFDWVLVDAPISSGDQPLAREPAGRFLQPYLNKNFVLFLDDIHRPGETEIAARWSTTFGWVFRSTWPAADVGIFRPADHSTAFNIV